MAVVTIPKLPPLSVQKNGKYSYIQTYKNCWDKEKKRSYRLPGSIKTVGKILGGGEEGVIQWSEEFLNQYPLLGELTAKRIFKGMKESKKIFEFKFEPLDEMISLTQAVNLKKLNAGATWVLDNIIAATPVSTALTRVFSSYNRHRKLLSLAYYLYLNANGALHLYEDFAAHTRLPYQRPLSSGQISKLLKSISDDEITKFLKVLNLEQGKIEDANVGKAKIYYAVDSTSVSTYAAKLTPAQWGHNKDGDLLKQINVLMIVHQETGLPLFYRAYAGAVPDVSTVANMLKDHALVGMERTAVMVTDKGYGAIVNIHRFLQNGLSFLTNIKTSLTFCKALIADNLTALLNECAIKRKIGCSCVTVPISWSYPISPGKRARDKAVLYVHIYLNRNIRYAYEKAIGDKTALIMEKMENNEALTDGEQNFFNKFIVKDDSGNYSLNASVKMEAMLDKGIRILISDCVSDPLEAWKAYFDRQRVEEGFYCFKQTVSGSRFRVSTDDTLRGKAFLTFLSCVIGLMFRRRADCAKIKGIELPYDSETKLIAALNSVQQTIYQDGGYYSKVVGKVKEIMEALDIPLPEPEPVDKALQQNNTEDEEDEPIVIEDLLTP